MPNMDKVMKGLELCTDRGGRLCVSSCPYYLDDDCTEQLRADVLTLLKEQEEQIRINTENFNHLAAKVGAMPEIVKCKECKHGQYEEWDNGECVDKTIYCDGYGIHKPDWFCADGERKQA